MKNNYLHKLFNSTYYDCNSPNYYKTTGVKYCMQSKMKKFIATDLSLYMYPKTLKEYKSLLVRALDNGNSLRINWTILFTFNSLCDVNSLKTFNIQSTKVIHSRLRKLFQELRIYKLANLLFFNWSCQEFCKLTFWGVMMMNDLLFLNNTQQNSLKCLSKICL